MIAGIVLAAGLSRRLGRPKQLLCINGEPLIRMTVRQVLASSLDQTIIVAGGLAADIATALADYPVRVVANPDYALGQSTSLRAGLAALSPEIEAAVFILGDQPELDPRVIDALVASWRDTRRPVVVPRYLEGVSNPVLFDRRVFPELAAIAGDIGARAVVQAHKTVGDLAIIDVDHHAPADVDTEGDYRALLERLRSKNLVVNSDHTPDRTHE